jgi:hypothetical protein
MGLYCFVIAISSSRTFLLTEHKRIGLGPPSTRPGDLTCVLYTADVPFVLRAKDETDLYQPVGKAYVHGVMNGEALLDRSYTEQDFLIV